MGAVQKIEPQNSVPALITPAEMIQHAIQQGSGVDVMERLLALQERYDAFNARKAFDDAMADLRSELPKITKSREVDYVSKGEGGGRVNYKFEDLAEIAEAISKPMSAVGLSFRWYTDNVQNGVKVTCRITHRAGHFEETSLVGPLDTSGKKNPIQAIGSAVTYLQRYTLKAAVGIAAAHDDDAQEVNNRAEPTTAKPTKPPVGAVYAGLESDVLTSRSEQVLKAVWAKADKSDLPDNLKDQLVARIDAKLAELRQPQKGEDFPGFVPPDFEKLEK